MNIEAIVGEGEKEDKWQHKYDKKGNLVHVAPACAGSREGSDHFGSIVRSLSLHFCKRLFPGLEPMTSWSQGSSFTTAPRLPFHQITCSIRVNPLTYLRADFSL